MSATTPGIRRIWVETVVTCVDQITPVSDDGMQAARNSRVTDSAADTKTPKSASLSSDDVSSRLQAEQKIAPSLSHRDSLVVSRSQTVLDGADDGLTLVPPAVSSDTELRTDSVFADVCMFCGSNCVVYFFLCHLVLFVSI